MSNLLKITCALLILFVSLEVVFRTMGFEVHKPCVTSIESEPNQILLYHTQFGLGLNPGQYHVTINEGLKYRANHLADSTRKTSSEDHTRKSLMYFYGCSFTYGMGVDDDSTFPWMVQEACPDWMVKNYAVPGYSSVHGLLQFKNAIETGILPDIVVVGYTSYQDARNQLSGIQQKYWSESLILNSTHGIETAHMPYVKKKDGHIEINYLPFSALQKRWRLSRVSVLIHRLENTISNIMFGFTDKYELTELVLEELNATCVTHDIELIVMALNKSESANKLENFCTGRHIQFLDATVDIEDSQYNLQPFDLHPNKTAHSYYAGQLIGYLEAEDICRQAKGRQQ